MARFVYALKRNWMMLTLLSMGSLVMMFPFLWALSVSLQGPGLAYQSPPIFFNPPYLFSNFAKVFAETDIFLYAFNSLLIASVCIIGNVLSNAFVGFGFAKYNFKGSQTLFFLALCMMMVPLNVIIIPIYLMWNSVGAIDTYWPLMVGHFLGTPFYIFLMRQTYMGIPHELYEATLMDGAKPPTIFLRIFLPLSKATLATIAINTFMACWNDVFTPLIFITSKSKYTLALSMLMLRRTFENNTELLMASAIITMLPIIIVFIFCQKYFMSSTISSGVKG